MRTKFSAPNNHLRENREDVLGWTQDRLAQAAKELGHQLSARTISRLEDGSQYYARTTFTKVHMAINDGRSKAALAPLSLPDIFPQLIAPADKKPPAFQGTISSISQTK